jgi:hypothetical protein
VIHADKERGEGLHLPKALKIVGALLEVFEMWEAIGWLLIIVFLFVLMAIG